MSNYFEATAAVKAIAKGVDREAGRYGLDRVHVAADAEGVRLTATDGRRLVIRVAPGEWSGEPVLLGPAVFAAIKPGRGRCADPTTVTVNGTVTVETGGTRTEFPPPEEGAFPDLTGYIDGSRLPSGAPVRVRLDAKQLRTVLDSLAPEEGPDGIASIDIAVWPPSERDRFDAESTVRTSAAVHFEAVHGKAFAILMPVIDG